MGPIEPKRILLDNVTIPAKTTTAFDNPIDIPLLVCQETTDEEKISDNTNTAQVPLYSKLVGLKGNFIIHNVSANERIRWMLTKWLDGEELVTNLTDATGLFHSSNDTPTARELRSLTLAKGFFVASDRLAGKLSFFVRKNTLHRLGSLRENDKIVLTIASSSTGSSSITGFGSLYCRLH
jgi:hypothetical protein